MGLDTSQDSSTEVKPALTIIIQSWVTPILGLAMLVVGLVLGYLVRPVLAPAIADTSVDAIAPTQTTVAVQPATTSAVVNQPAPQSQEELMDFLISQTKHFVGSEDAPVTIIEFSDFQ